MTLRHILLAPRRFRASLVLLATVAVLATAVLGLAGCGGPVSLKGTDLGMDPAPDFQLDDPNGTPVTLASLRGKVVVLTFLYTRCPDVCPLIAERLRTSGEQLGNLMSRVAFVAISVDPDNDTPDAIKSFLTQHRLADLTYLAGTRARLQPVWAAYYVAAQGDPLHPDLVSHSTRVVVIDSQGRQRANLDADFDPADLVFNVRTLLNE